MTFIYDLENLVRMRSFFNFTKLCCYLNCPFFETGFCQNKIGGENFCIVNLHLRMIHGLI